MERQGTRYGKKTREDERKRTEKEKISRGNAGTGHKKSAEKRTAFRQREIPGLGTLGDSPTGHDSTTRVDGCPAHPRVPRRVFVLRSTNPPERTARKGRTARTTTTIERSRAFKNTAREDRSDTGASLKNRRERRRGGGGRVRLSS